MTLHRRPWDGFVPAEDQEVYALAGFGKPVGFGSRPAPETPDFASTIIGASGSSQSWRSTGAMPSSVVVG